MTFDQIMEKIASKQPVEIEANHCNVKRVQVLYSPDTNAWTLFTKYKDGQGRAMEESNIEDIRFLLMNLV